MAAKFKEIFQGADMDTFSEIFDYIFKLITEFFKQIFNEETGLDKTTVAPAEDA